MKKILGGLLVLSLMFLPASQLARADSQDVLQDTGYGEKIWTVTGSGTNTTTLTITKAANRTTRWAITDFSAGGTQNGTFTVVIGGVTKWKMGFPANCTTGQKIVITGALNQAIQIVVTLNSSGDVWANIRGTVW